MNGELPISYTCESECAMSICSRETCRLDALRNEYHKQANEIGAKIDSLDQQKEALLSKLAQLERDYRSERTRIGGGKHL